MMEVTVDRLDHPDGDLSWGIVKNTIVVCTKCKAEICKQCEESSHLGMECIESYRSQGIIL